MKPIEICNLRNEKCKYPFDIRVDRASILGNSFYMNHESDRDSVCDKYEKYFDSKFANDFNFRQEVLRLIAIYEKYGQLRLFCWCFPKRCHSMYIKKIIEKLIEKEN